MIRRGDRLDERFSGLLDVDLCLRARERGQKVVYAPDARLYHLESATFRLGGPSYYHQLVRFRRRWPNCLPDPFYVANSESCYH